MSQQPAEICPWCKEETSHTLETCCLLQGGALQDRPYPTSGALVRSTPVKAFPQRFTPAEIEQLDREMAEGREAGREIQRRANKMKVHP